MVASIVSCKSVMSLKLEPFPPSATSDWPVMGSLVACWMGSDSSAAKSSLKLGTGRGPGRGREKQK